MALMQEFGDIFDKCKITLLTVLMKDVFSIFSVQCITKMTFFLLSECFVCLFQQQQSNQ